MTDTKLLSLIRVSETGSFTRAADSLSLTQPAVSQHIRQLENEFGVKIFEHSHNKFRLTREGETLVKYARRVLTAYDRMEQALISGNIAQFEELRGYMTETNQVDGQAVSTGVKGQLKESVQKGLIGDEKAADILEEYLGVKAGTGWSQVEKWKQEMSHADDEDYSYTKYGEVLEAVKAGGDTQAAAKKLMDHGIKEKEIKSEIKSAIGKWYKEGEISKSAAESKIKQYVPSLDSNDIYWTMKEWDWEKQHGSGTYKKYNTFFDAVETGKNLQTVVREYVNHGVDKDTLSRQITSQYKEQFVKLYKTNYSKAMELRRRLATA